MLDLYVAFLTGACVCIIPEGIASVPQRLVSFLIREKITVWYSVPSVLILMMRHGGLLEAQDLALRTVLFAGEPFPIKYLRQLRQHWRSMRFLNLYGPTETNVCTYYEVKEIPSEQIEPVPIGQACSGDQVWAVKADGTVARVGEEGELIVSGPTVMLGYWGQSSQQLQPYATGDIVRVQGDNNYVLVGRRDHLIKVRGYRIELGEIETTLLAHPEIVEAAVVVTGQDMEARLVAFLVASVGSLSLMGLNHSALKVQRFERD